MVNDYIAVDIETSGLNPKYDRIIEIGAARIRQGAVTDTFDCLINAGVKIPDRITELTGITNGMLKEGISLRQAIEEFHIFCGDEVLLGHNVMFDFSFLKKAAVNHRLSFEKKGIDTLKLARIFLPELEKRSLEYLTEYFDIETIVHHRAFEDAKAASDLYQILLAKFYETSPFAFEPKPLLYTVKRESPVTPRQKTYLNDLLHYHKLSIEVKIENLSKNEASRIIDNIIFEHGRMQ